MNKVLACLLALSLIALICAVVGYQYKLRCLREDHGRSLEALRSNYDRQITDLGGWLAEQQAEVGRATILVKGIPTAEKQIFGYPVCNLGCVSSTTNGVNVEDTFVQAYNARLKGLHEKTQKGPSQGG